MWKALSSILAILLLFVIAVSGVKEQRLSAELLTAQQKEADNLVKISGLEIKMAELEKVWGEFKGTIKANQALKAESERLAAELDQFEAANGILNGEIEHLQAENSDLKKEIETLKQEKIKDLMI